MRFKLLVCLLVFLLAIGFSIEATETSKFVPDSCISVVTISNIQTDPGISWLLDAWINSPRESPLREFFKSTAAKEMSVAVFPPEGDSPLYLLFVVGLTKGTKVDKDKLNNVIIPDPDAKLQTVSYKGTKINFISVDTPEDFTAYAALQDNVLFGASVDVLKKALDGPSIEKSPGYQNVHAQFHQANDGLLFADNTGAKFVNFLQPLEEKWKMSLLLSAEYLEWMGSSFDVINSTKVAGKFVLQGQDTTHIEDIQDDAEFLGEAFKRKFIAEKIDYSSKIEVKDRTVVLNFQIEGIEPLWKKLFAQGVLSLIRPESSE